MGCRFESYRESMSQFYSPQNYWYWERNAIPSRFKPHICLCENFDPGMSKKVPGAPACRTCGKLPRWFVKECGECKELFLYDFRSPGFCVINPRCFEHVDHETVCEHVAPARKLSEIVTPKLTRKIIVDLSKPIDFSVPDFTL